MIFKLNTLYNNATLSKYSRVPLAEFECFCNVWWKVFDCKTNVTNSKYIVFSFNFEGLSLGDFKIFKKCTSCFCKLMVTLETPCRNINFVVALKVLKSIPNNVMKVVPASCQNSLFELQRLEGYQKISDASSTLPERESRTQCRNLDIYLSIRFYVKSTFANLEL